MSEKPSSAQRTASPQGRRQTQQDHYFYQTHAKPTVETSYRIRLISGNSNPGLAQNIARFLSLELTPAVVTQFANGEINIKIEENVRGDDVFIIQPTTGTPNVEINTALMELLLLIHTLRLSSVKRITAIVPYFAYSRQDRKAQSRVPISASAVSQLIQSMGVDRVMTVDLHCGQIQGFFRNMPMDNLLLYPEFAKYVKGRPWFNPRKTVVVSPDAGGVERANVLADQIGASHIVTILKRRVEANQVDSMQTVGNVDGFSCIIIDDMVDTAGTLIKACQLLKKMGATKVVACATHGIMTDPACARVNDSTELDELVVSDSIPQEHNTARVEKLTVLSIAPMVGETVLRVHNEHSVSQLFPKEQHK